jgi:hypothetical protein
MTEEKYRIGGYITRAGIRSSAEKVFEALSKESGLAGWWTKNVKASREDNGVTVVLFAQRGWREQVEFMHYCSTKWGTYLLSLKSLCETGKGTPYPEDVDMASIR